MTPTIALNGVKKSFGDNYVLNGVDFTIEKAQSLVIIGGSGTGKSVTLKCILGLLEPDQGSIQIDGQEITTLSSSERQPYLKRIGMLFQGAALFDSLSVWENVAFGLTHGKKIPPQEAYPIALEKLTAVGLKEDVALLSPAELSGGMKKRVGLARAIATNPEIIFFDEPTTGLDPIMADVINQLIVKCTKELGATTLSITHDMRSATIIGDTIAMLYHGKIIWHGRADEIETCDNPYVQQFYTGSATGPII